MLGIATLLLLVVMGLLGMANGAVFQLVPNRFANEIGVATGIIGTPVASADSCCRTYWEASSRRPAGAGFFVFAMVGGFGGAMALAHVSRQWRGMFSKRRRDGIEQVLDRKPRSDDARSKKSAEFVTAFSKADRIVEIRREFTLFACDVKTRGNCITPSSLSVLAP